MIWSKIETAQIFARQLCFAEGTALAEQTSRSGRTAA
jgi:hypothetical protein